MGRQDRLNATNWLDLQCRGQRRFVHPRCKNTIKGYRSVTYKEGAEDFVVGQGPWARALATDGLLDPVGNESGKWKVGSGKSRMAQVY